MKFSFVHTGLNKSNMLTRRQKGGNMFNLGEVLQGLKVMNKKQRHHY